MKRYYITDSTAERGFVELTETEWLSLFGEESYRSYIGKLYRGEITLEDIPTEYQASVQACVDARIARFGTYDERELSSEELSQMIKEVL